MNQISKLIAGVHIQMSSETINLKVMEERAQQPFYAAYFEKPDIELKIFSGISDSLKDAEILFETTGLWSGCIKGDKFIITLRSTDNHSPPMTVVTKKDAAKVDVFVHPGFFSSDSDVQAMTDPFRYPLDQILIMNHLAHRSGMIIHAAGMSVDGAGIICAGVSGSGKSTISRLIAEAAPDIRLLSDERIIVRKINGQYLAYGTPWHSNADIAQNDSTPLKTILFLKKDRYNRINRLSPAEAIRRLFPVVSCPWYDKERMPLVLSTCEDLLSEIPCFDFCFTPDKPAVMMLTEFMKSNSYSCNA